MMTYSGETINAEMVLCRILALQYQFRLNAVI